MNMKSKFLALIIGAATLGAVQQATAADLPPAAPVPYNAPAVVAAFNWTGVYVGVYGGYGFGTLQNSGLLGQDISLSGGMAGGTIGYNYQPVGSAFVFGVEADGGWADISAKDSFSAGGVTVTEQTKIQATASARARIGAAFDRLLVYATGGGGWVRNKLTFGVSAPAFGITGSVSDTQNHMGYVVGAGFELPFVPNWSFKAEYLYWGMGSENYFQSTVNLASGDVNFHTVKLGVNYRF